MIELKQETRAPMTAAEMAAPAFIDRLGRRALLIGIVFGVAAIIGAIVDTQQFFRSYLVGFMLTVGLSMGGLALLMLQYLTKGNWGFVIRRQLEAASRNLPLVALFFIPLAIAAFSRGMYPWTIGVGREGGLTLEQSQQMKYASYMTLEWWLVRAIIYFLIWWGLTLLLNRWGARQDEGEEDWLKRSRRYQKLSAPGVIIYAYTISLAVTDWVQSLDPTWYSTMFGLMFVAGETLLAMSFCIMLTRALARYEPVSKIMQPSYWHDLGNMTLAIVMLFAYFSFSQFLIIWSGNLPDEIHWFMRRVNGGWGVWGLVTVFMHFAVPFFFLLIISMKRNPKPLFRIVLCLFLARYFDLVWNILPSYPKVGRLPSLQGHFYYSWQDFVIPVALVGLWIAAFCRQLKQRPLYPVYDLLWPEINREHHGR